MEDNFLFNQQQFADPDRETSHTSTLHHTTSNNYFKTKSLQNEDAPYPRIKHKKRDMIAHYRLKNVLQSGSSVLNPYPPSRSNLAENSR